ncbi:TIGR04282 family arsenosugar biosynthesis glycosyltransferase [Nocardia jejuensis]|uniref:TIGR04282 family arsenosugar biosynthesis glycosyltransferase n=1 Tax=Nocardia jejuensis TaxID=328049 RepID=UPI000834CE2D|nr:TIGR04282 family arsenosugar biosynthesis glycosyltransferase [Nocardia jejuensis]
MVPGWALPVTLLLIAKAPIAGFAKTRLTPPFSPREAAQLAAASLLDTLAAMRGTSVQHRVVAWTGDLADAEQADEIAHALREFTVIPQRGADFGERLANAHADAARPGLPVLQIGMDTPQLDPALLAASAIQLLTTADAVLGPATDGGWWALGLPDPRPARLLAQVPMSTDHTGEDTRNMLRRCGFHPHALPTLTDVDTYDDARTVAARCHGRFAAAVARACAADAEVLL